MYSGKIFLSFTFFIAFLANVVGQISGQIVDQQTNEPLIGAHIWINQSRFGTVSDENGEFQLTGKIFSDQQIIVTYIGYEPWEMTIDTSNVVGLIIEMSPQTHAFEEITVIGESSSSRKKNINYFLRNFFGYTKNANKCTLRNPDVLRFTKKEDGLYVYATDLLDIQNEALGYELKFLLKEAIVNNDDARYKGKVLFTEINDEKKEGKWRKNREKTMAGSSRHFLQSLLNKSVDEEGYDIFHSLASNAGVQRIGKAIPSKIISLTDESKGHYQVKFSSYLEVVYRKEKMPLSKKPRGGNAPKIGHPAEKEMMHNEDTESFTSNVEQLSWLKLTKSTLLINEWGIPLEPGALEEHGYWADERVADLLPFDYELTGQN